MIERDRMTLYCDDWRHLTPSAHVQACPAVDLVIRTSGESRLSDFLLLQSSTAYLHFSDALWPAFSFYDMLDAFTSFQRMAPTLACLRTSCADAGPKSWHHACTDTAVRVGLACNAERCQPCGWIAKQTSCGGKALCKPGGATSEGSEGTQGCVFCRGTSLCQAL